MLTALQPSRQPLQAHGTHLTCIQDGDQQGRGPLAHMPCPCGPAILHHLASGPKGSLLQDGPQRLGLGVKVGSVPGAR